MSSTLHISSTFRFASITTIIVALQLASSGMAQPSETEATRMMQQKVFDTRLSIDIQDLPLGDFAKRVEQETRIPVRIHERSLEDSGIRHDATISCNLTNASLHSVLKWSLREAALTYYVEPEGIVICSKYEAEFHQQTKFHHVPQLVGSPHPDYDSLIELTIGSVDDNSWEELGGPGSIAPINSGMVIMQTTRRQLLVGRLYQQLVEAQAMPADDYAVASRLISHLPEETIKLQKQIKSSEVELSFNDVPLGEAIESIRQKTKLNLVLDIRTLEDIGLNADTPVSLRSGNRSLARSLTLLLEPLSLVWQAHDDVVVLSTWDTFEAELDVRIYPVRDLVWRGLDQQDPHIKQRLAKFYPPITIRFPYPDLPYKYLLPSPVLDSIPADKNLQDVLTTTISPESWQELGGPGSITFLPSADCLVVAQTASVHDQLSGVLQEIRQASRPLDLDEFLAAIEKENAEIVTEMFEPHLSVDGTPLFQESEMQKIARQIQSHVDPESWKSDDCFIEAVQGNLSVRNRRDTQREVLAWLVNLGIVQPPMYGGSCRGPVYGSFAPTPPEPSIEDTPNIPTID